MTTINNTSGVILKLSTAYTRSFFFGSTGANVTVSISKAGGSFGAAANSPATEIANGFYKITLTSSADLNTAGDLAFNCSSTTSGSTTQFSVWTDQVASQIVTDISPGCVRQGVAFNNFPFTMTQGGIPKAGLAPAAQQNSGLGWIPCTNSPVDGGNGCYFINLTGLELSSPAVSLLFTSGQGDSSLLNIITMP